MVHYEHVDKKLKELKDFDPKVNSDLQEKFIITVVKNSD